MKKKYSCFSLLLLLTSLLFAQAPNKMSYQAVIRNSNNVVVSNHAVGMRISILQGTATGTSVYTETQTPTTNTNGLIAIEIGAGTVVSGSFANIDWANGPYFVKTETDPNGGNNYTLTGTSQLLSMPYALHAKTATKTDTASVAKLALNGVPSGGLQGQSLTICEGQMVWATGGLCPAKISAFNCADTVHSGVLFNRYESTNVTSSISYSGGNGGVYEVQAIASTGVEGLIATLASGTLVTGSGTLIITINGTPKSAGIASFNIVIGNKTCILNRYVHETPPIGTWQIGTVFCSGTPTSIINVTNPITGKTWMDRNLGASRAAISSTDTAAYGDLYQWGRGAVGHQCRNSGTTSTLSTSDQPNHSNFILAPNSPYDWRSTQNNNLWQGVNGVNIPCPAGYRIPTYTELENERASWSQNNSTGAYASPLKLTITGVRNSFDGALNYLGVYGNYWSSSVNGSNVWNLNFNSIGANMVNNMRAIGFSVRCIKDNQPSVGSIDTVGSINNGVLYAGMAASNTSTTLNYTNGNGTTYETQTVSSTGVTGLTATLAAGTLNNGNGTFTLTISGTPTSSGVASFNIVFGDKSCTIQRTILNLWPSGTMFCSGSPTVIVNVTNPVTGKTWMDRNLGATQASIGSTDAAGYGDLYQWGRRADGHQCRNSGTTNTLSTSNQPPHANFIFAPSTPNDWRSPQNDNLWQGINGVNNPCPAAYRLPTYNELEVERTTWSQNNSVGAFGAVLKFPMAGFRNNSDGSLRNVGSLGYYWSSNLNTTRAWYLFFSTTDAFMNFNHRSFGYSVRCIKD